MEHYKFATFLFYFILAVTSIMFAMNSIFDRLMLFKASIFSDERIDSQPDTKIGKLRRNATSSSQLKNSLFDEEELIVLNLVKRYVFLKMVDYFAYFVSQPKHARISKQPFRRRVVPEDMTAVFNRLEAEKILLRNQHGRYSIIPTSPRWQHHLCQQQASMSALTVTEVVGRLWELYELSDDDDALNLYHPMYYIATIGDAYEITRLLEHALDTQTVFTFNFNNDSHSVDLNTSFCIKQLIFPTSAVVMEGALGIEKDYTSKYKYWGLQRTMPISEEQQREEEKQELSA